MKIEKLPQEFVQAQPILATLEQAGYEAYFVGGSVRDTLLGAPIHDVDIASSAFPEEVKALFNRTVDTGIQHGTVMVLDHGEGYEITTFRTESTYTDFRRPDSVTFVRSLSEDLKRRDFTINALAMRHDGEVVDLFDGLSDMTNGIIRAVGDAETRFTEDALRMMRALRFSAQLGFRIADDTRQALRDLAPNLTRIAVERIRVEFEKMLMGGNAAESLKLALDDGVINYLPGEPLKIWDNIIQHLATHQPADTFAVWSLVLAETDLTSSQINRFLRNWKLSRETITTVMTVVPLIRQIDKVSTFDLYQALPYQKTLFELLTLLDVSNATIGQIRHIIDMLPITNSSELAIQGGDLIRGGVMMPGPKLGKCLKKIEYAVVNGELENTRESLIQYAKEQVNDDN
ncbi:CCA tRNA nucleotidyltransferase [Leuconostoc falkenbergense]|uniref:CCA tRNA nucleotidyltransferase n=1 Tax=Leuconostoc falkenbergense TaxID=2766470 RepID=UPI0021AB02D3|nr:CCA tRNA nucleotidyltransferase [Leuconostoc falkenbergense]MCT4390100.1 CCA tRNA nucleotidyltransferase [Leuconostoc falkenbergense]